MCRAVSFAVRTNRDIRSLREKLGGSARALSQTSGWSGTSDYDATEALQAALDYLNQSAASGSLFVPRGIYHVTGLVLILARSVPIKIFGEGPRLSTLRKTGGGRDPVLRIDASAALDDYIFVEDISFDGVSKGCAGLEIENLARLRCVRVDASNCSTGINLSGALICEFVKCTTNGNSRGVNARKSSSGIYPNLILFDRLEARDNSIAGVDIGDGEAYQFVGCDLTANGTAGDLTTGGVLLRRTIGEEPGIATVTFSGCYFEVN